jgi:hypothetical protein
LIRFGGAPPVAERVEVAAAKPELAFVRLAVGVMRISKAVFAAGRERNALMGNGSWPPRRLAIISFHFAVSACSGEPARNAQLSQGSLNEHRASDRSLISDSSTGSHAVRQSAQVAI